MKIITASTQEQFDKISDKFTGRIAIHDGTVNIRRTYRNSTIEVYGNSKVTIKADNKIKAYHHSHVIVYGFCKVVARNNSKIEAYNNFDVLAYNDCEISTYDYANVKAFDNCLVSSHCRSNVIVLGNAVVNAYDNSFIRSFDETVVYAYDSSKVMAAKGTALNDNRSVESSKPKTKKAPKMSVEEIVRKATELGISYGEHQGRRHCKQT